MTIVATQEKATNQANDAPAADEPQVLPLVALRDTVIFPEMIVPLQVGRDRSQSQCRKQPDEEALANGRHGSLATM